ncbi:MAG: 50S ribosomal protein L11 methyltransferase [Syntrophobacterales bacterium]|nr:50S ribosomal protein L11 methyltransferase [Syntrophobacterales bacterium]
MAEPQPSGWSYRLSPRLVLGTHGRPPGAAPGDRVLLVSRGEAFPPGHPTTRLCLDLLREALPAMAAARLLDVGCGAGVLSLAAAALGVPQVVGVDISRPAARTTRQNARHNGLAGPILTVQGSTECIKGGFDLVVANLPWEVQLGKILELNRLAKPSGRVILSGFRDNQESLLLESYLKLGWFLQRRLTWDFQHPELPPDMSFTWAAWLLGEAAPA